MKYFEKNTLFWVAIGAVFFTTFLGGVPLFDRSELQLAELAREMVTSGQWLHMQIGYERFTDFPPLFLWLQSLAMLIFGVGEFAARFPNALLGVIVLPFLYVSGKFLLDRKFGFLWAMSWFGSILPFFYFKSGIAAPLFNFLVFNALFFIIHFIWAKNSYRHLYFSRSAQSYLWLAGIFMGLAMLAKGPGGYFLLVLTGLVYGISMRFSRFLSFLSFLKFSTIALLVFLLWFGIDYFLHGPQFITQFAERQWQLFTENSGPNSGFPGFHFLVLLVGCFPASIFALRGLGPMQGIKYHMRDFQRWMIILLIVVLVVFSLVDTKIVHYSSLAYYPVSFLSALALWHFLEFPRSYKGWLTGLVVFVGLIAFGASIALPWAGMNPEKVQAWIQNDAFAAANLKAEVSWTLWSFLPAVLMGLILLLFAFYVKKHKVFAFRVLFFGTGVWVFLALVFFVGKIERITQHAAVTFFEKQRNEKVYVTTFGYKSYIPLFYGRVKPCQHPKAAHKEWLYHGDTDKDVLISTKVIHKDALEEEMPDARFLYRKNGFYFYRRKQEP